MNSTKQLQSQSSTSTSNSSLTLGDTLLFITMPKLNYAENEKVLCFHGPLMYEAKILTAELWNKETNRTGEVGPHYNVHYKGWKQSWDEWVPEERLKKYNEENIKKQKVLIEAQRARDAAERIAQAKLADAEAAKRVALGIIGNGTSIGGVGGSTTPITTMGGVGSVLGGGGVRRDDKRSGKGRKDGEGEDEYMKRPEIKISIPDPLKVQLVDDWEAITKNQQLVALPRSPNVDTILDEWLKFLANDEPERRRIAAEVAHGLRLYFNKALGNNLLYRFERGQYGDQRKVSGDEEPEMSRIYGAEHLLRLFVNLPELLAHTAMDPDATIVLKENVSHFLHWMALNQHMLFATGYENTSTAYQNNNRG